MVDMKTSEHLSDKQVVGIGSCIRAFTQCRKIIEKNLHTTLPKVKDKFNELYTCKFEDFEDKDGNKISSPWFFVMIYRNYWNKYVIIVVLVYVMKTHSSNLV